MDPLSFIIALAAIIVSPWISYIVAKKQITANLVSANRQKWIEIFREAVADYLTKYTETQTATVLKDKTKDILRNQVTGMFQLSQKFKILIPISSSYRNKFIDTIFQINDLLIDALSPLNNRDTAGSAKLSEELVEISHKIIQEEMELISWGK